MNNSALVRFFKEEKASVLFLQIGLTVVLSGLASIALLGMINEVAFNGRMQPNDLAYFAVAILVFAFGTRFINIRFTQVVEGRLANIRLRLMSAIRRAELTDIESMGKDDVHLALSQDVVLVSNSADMLIAIVQQSVMLVFCLVYVAWLSPVGFAIVSGTIAITYFLLSTLASILSDNYASLAKEEGKLFGKIDHLIHGFKEIRLNQKKSDHLYLSYCGHVDETERLKVDNRVHASWTILASHLFLYLLLGGIIFGMPFVVDSSGGLVGKMVATMLFILTPLLLIQEGIPTVERANSALKRIYHLEQYFKNKETQRPGCKIETFERLTLDKSTYHYPLQDKGGAYEADTKTRKGFQVGPLELSIHVGEIIFITGGNGSGKSTLLKMLCGLYTPTDGSVSVNNTPITGSNIAALREQFAIVFTDFHLFDEFYGLPDVDENRVNELIQKMELQEKVTFKNNAFSTVHLSTGQRKRLALIMAVLDDKNIFIFDEWAADQDAHFRDYFYRSILPELKNQGKTVIAVTHDDRYWGFCDRLFKVDLGKVSEAPVDRHVPAFFDQTSERVAAVEATCVQE